MFWKYIRRLITVSFYKFIRVDFSFYKNKVDDYFKLDSMDRSAYLEEVILKNAPISSDGKPLVSFEDWKNVKNSSKKDITVKKLNRLFFTRKTSGTTGSPTIIKLNPSDMARFLGVRAYCYSHYGVNLGDREARLWKRGSSGFKSKVQDFVLNRKNFHPVGSSALEEVDRLIKWRPDYIYGYSSLVVELAQIIDKNNISFEGCLLVVCTAENITISQKQFVERVLKSKVVEEYGMTEFDIVAFDCHLGHRHLVNPWLIVEREDDQLLISDIARESQNLIKYIVTDEVEICDGNCKELGSSITLDKVVGRSSNRYAFNYDMSRVHSSVFSTIMNQYACEFDDFLDFCIVQYRPGELSISVNSTPKVGLVRFEKLFSEHFFRLEGSSFSLEVNVVKNLNETDSKRSYFTQKLI